ncbi:MAG: hypothetical protein CSA26_02445 [Desulfobacterales bacterium]|nr:MAG: hypothetical protein CSA26_02445 [Desulfobacterales bacterium]
MKNNSLLLIAAVSFFLGNFCQSALAESDAASAGTATKWMKASSEIAREQQLVRKDVSKVANAIKEHRKALTADLKKVRTDVKQAKERVKNLQDMLAKLRSREGELGKELAEKKKEMGKIETIVWDNAALFLADSHRYSGKAFPEGWQEKLAVIAREREFPTIDDITLLLDSVTEAIEESGSITVNESVVYGADGIASKKQVLRLGSFQSYLVNELGPGFLDAKKGVLEAVAYLPNETEKALLNNATEEGSTVLPLDFSGGSFLRNPPKEQKFIDKLKEGGVFIWPILLIALVGLLLIIERLISLFFIRINGNEAAELTFTTSTTPAERVAAAVMAEGESMHAEAMEARMEKAILGQLPPLERFMQTIKVFAAVSPLLGLLGTVSGIVQTFRIITAYGNGDPKLLSIGISEALLTTQLDLLVAIPLLLCHHFLDRRSTAIITDMEYTGMALITRHAVELGGKDE